MLNYSLSETASLSNRVRAHTHTHTHAHASIANNVHLLNFSKTANGSTSTSAPAAKSWFTKKLIPAVKRIGDIAGKVATVASIL